MNIPEASQVAELIQKLHSIAVHINDRHNHSNLPPVAMGWCEEAIDFLRLYLEAGKEVPEEIHGKHENCFDIDMGYCVTHGEDVDIHPEYMRGFNTARSQFIPLLMAEKAKSAEKDREIERLNNIELAKAITDIPKNGTGILLSEKSYNALKSQLASAQERIKELDKQNTELVQEAVKQSTKVAELEIKMKELEERFKLYGGQEVFDKIAKLEAIAERVRDVEKMIEKFIPDVYCDVYPLCVEVIGYSKDKMAYKLQQENGRDLAQAIKQFLLGEVGKNEQL